MGKFFATTGEDVGPTGWITEEGEFIECSIFEHDAVVYERGLFVHEVELRWIRIGLWKGANYLQFRGENLTKAQDKALTAWGIEKWGANGRLGGTENFKEAYCERKKI